MLKTTFFFGVLAAAGVAQDCGPLIRFEGLSLAGKHLISQYYAPNGSTRFDPTDAQKVAEQFETVPPHLLDAVESSNFDDPQLDPSERLAALISLSVAGEATAKTALEHSLDSIILSRRPTKAHRVKQFLAFSGKVPLRQDLVRYIARLRFVGDLDRESSGTAQGPVIELPPPRQTIVGAPDPKPVLPSAKPQPSPTRRTGEIPSIKSESTPGRLTVINGPRSVATTDKVFYQFRMFDVVRYSSSADLKKDLRILLETDPEIAKEEILHRLSGEIYDRHAKRFNPWSDDRKFERAMRLTMSVNFDMALKDLDCTRLDQLLDELCSDIQNQIQPSN